MSSIFEYLCTNEECNHYNIVLHEDEIIDDRKCIYCGNPTIDVDLYEGDEHCKHEELKYNWNGIKCSKCKGWCCL